MSQNSVDPADAGADTAAAAKDKKSKLPAKVRLVRPHGFIDEDGTHRYWKAGDVVSDPATIKLLSDRKAPIIDNEIPSPAPKAKPQAGKK